MIIDTHSHLYLENFDQDRKEVMERTLAAGVEKVVLPAVDSETHDRLLMMCREYPSHCYPLMGLHPTSVNDNPGWEEQLRLVEDYLRSSADGTGVKFYGVGEVGMDLYWSKDFRDRQEEVFRSQIELSIRYGLPLIIHTREAWAEMRDILSSYRGQGLKGIMHSFSGTLDDYRYILGCGDFLFGIGGPVTYKKSTLAEDILPRMQPEHLVLETDSPYLPPVPYRGKRNESSYVVNVCVKVAEVTGRSVDDITRITTENALKMFNL